MVWLGIVIGFIVGALVLQWPGGLAGAFVGFIVALAWKSRTQAMARKGAGMPPMPMPLPARPAPAAATADAVVRRLDAIEARLSTLEGRLAGAPGGDVRWSGNATTAAPVSWTAPAPEAAVSGTASLAPAEPVLRAAPPVSRATAEPAPEPITAPAPAAAQVPDATVPPGFVRGADGTLAPAAGAAAPLPPRAPETTPPIGPAPTPSVNPLWAWFTGGNALTRIGVVALFLGVGFLLKYLAEIVTIPIELRLFGVALAGVALAGLGIRLAASRPGYGLSLQGAGVGILYLTTFAALRLYDVLPAGPAFVLLVAIAVATVWLAVRADSQALAALAVAGGFLAPFLVATSSGEPALLFGYFAVLNAAIFALAWLRAWRALNVLGFVFTFVLAIFWGERYYRPEHFATVEPFLVAFFLFYVAIAVLYAKRGALEAKAPVDAVLVFGVPLVAFALQASLVYDTRYGVAWSAFALAILYGVLAAALFRPEQPALALLARAFFALAVIFATVAIPFAVDPQWTTAWWALEAAGVYWIATRQKQPIARGFALFLQVAAALAFLGNDVTAGGTPFLNAAFLGCAFIAVAALATAFVADRHATEVSRFERAVVPWLVLWGGAWWLGGGGSEVMRLVSPRAEGHAVLAFATGSIVVALAALRFLHWPRLVWFGAVLLPLMGLVAVSDWLDEHTTLALYGIVVWPAAWITHWAVLRAAEALRADADDVRGRLYAALRFVHALSAIALVAWLSWEVSEWVGRHFPAGTVWVACGAAWPAIVYLALAARVDDTARWPLGPWRTAYVGSAGAAVASLLGVWFVIVNAISPGATAPLPYLPLANPLDLTLAAALAVLFAWARRTLMVSERVLYAWFAAALFLFLNALVFRAIHHWLDVPWRFTALMASKPLQAALTLTWTATALPLMLIATKRAIRPLWMVGAALLVVVVVKLFALDLGALSGLPRVVAFLGVGALLLVIGYVAPLPPARTSER
ncbi:MAG: DUF2339 domain-containing protein [Burkholderiales bacterium]